MNKLTIGMATFNDFHGVWFSINAIRLQRIDVDLEFVVVDNFGCDVTKRFVESTPGARYIRMLDVQGTAAPRNRVFAEATGDFVLCMDCHVLFERGAIEGLIDYLCANPASSDLIQGPLIVLDAEDVISTHWSTGFEVNGMIGRWQFDSMGSERTAPAFPIPNMGLGVFVCRRDAWPGFNPRFRGFGGEEGYIHEKFRQRGDQALCLPCLRWAHRFDNPTAEPRQSDKLAMFRNTLIGHLELSLDLGPLLYHYSSRYSMDVIRSTVQSTLDDMELSISDGEMERLYARVEAFRGLVQQHAVAR